ncbi:MAG: EAL domain-containing protein [Burkholderiaceae bacterium]|nr:EAL domain-containing protein [Burkholderiaceae bacterium]
MTHAVRLLPGPLLRLHQFLLFDYNARAATFWWTMVLLGAATLALSVRAVAALPTELMLAAVGGLAVATIAGLFPIAIARTRNSFVAGEIFVFFLLLTAGPAAAALAAAGEASAGAFRSSRRWSSRIGSPTAAALSMYLCGSLWEVATRALGAAGLHHPATGIALLLGVALAHSFTSSVLVTTVMKLKANQPLALHRWFADFGWFGLTYVANAALAGLLHLSFQQYGVAVLLAAVPVLALFLAAVHYFLAQQEAAERERLARTEAAEREAAQAARHVDELARSESRFHSAFSHASIGMALVTIDGRLVQANRALCQMLGYEEAELIGRGLGELVDLGEGLSLGEELARLAVRQMDTLAAEVRGRHREGRELWLSLHSGLFDDASSSEPCLIVQVQDVTARRRAEHRLHQIAFHDGLTGLVNRMQFNELLKTAIERARSGVPGMQFAVLFLDFDRFKLINDSLGHGAGDRFLVEVAQRIGAVVRPTDVVARLGGDEFAVLLLNLERESAAHVLAERLQQVVRKPILVGDTEVATSVSIGITYSHFGYASAEEVLRDADTAMYRAKSLGRARFAVFDSGLHATVSDRLAMENDLRRAIEQRQLSIVYQPIVRLSDSALLGFEALLRWRHAERGDVSPAVFIPVAEESGLIGPLTDFVLGQACTQLRALQLRYPAVSPLRMHVNISGHDLQDSSLVQRVAQAVEAAALQPQDLTLEITEGMLMERIDTALETLVRLHQLGVGLSVDDFGTGYSSLSYLSSMPIGSLKIDASFVRRLQADGKDSEIVRAVIQLGAALGKVVIAEGIETRLQADRLRDLGCDLGQGYLLSRPLPAIELASLLAANLDQTEGPVTRPHELRSAVAYLH